MVEVHERNIAVAGLLARGPLADFLKHALGTFHPGLEADGVAQLGTALLIGLLHLGSIFTDK